MNPSIRRVRLKLTAWYIAVIALILITFGAAVYVVVDVQTQAGLDRSLERTVDRRTKLLLTRVIPKDIAQDTALYERRVFVFDAFGNPYSPEWAQPWTQEFARQVLRDSIGRRTVRTPDGRTWLLYGKRFLTLRGNTYATVAIADAVELRDRYPSIVTGFVASALLALLLVGVGGATLASKSTTPIISAFEQMRRFMGDAAHELKTPVAVLRARADVALQKPRGQPEYEDILGHISGEAQRLGKLVENMLQLARADAGQWPVAREKVFLDDVLMDATSAASALGAEKGVQVDIGTLEESPVEGDPTLLRQLFMILLDNAIHFTPAGGQVTASLQRNGRYCSVVVADTGTGIPEEAIPHIFERFYRADPARGRAGAGLGLSIAKWIVDAHAAEIRVRSKEGKGTTITVDFGLATSA